MRVGKRNLENVRKKKLNAAMSVTYRKMQLAKLGFNHPKIEVTADASHIFMQNSHEVTVGTQPFEHILVHIW